jgi:hypothetical protein
LRSASAVAQALRVLRQPRPLGVHARHQVERGIDRAQHRRRQRRGVDEAGQRFTSQSISAREPAT